MWGSGPLILAVEYPTAATNRPPKKTLVVPQQHYPGKTADPNINILGRHRHLLRPADPAETKRFIVQ